MPLSVLGLDISVPKAKPGGGFNRLLHFWSSRVLVDVSMRISLAAILFLLGSAGKMMAAGPVDYVKEIKPILVENCYKCHGAAAQKGGLRLDTAALAIKGGDTGPAIIS